MIPDVEKIVEKEFFEKKEMQDIFANKFSVISQEVEVAPKNKEIALLITLFQKK